MTRILLFGKNGQVGWELQRTLAPLGDVMAVDRQDVDFMDLKGLRTFALEVKPDLIVNAAAYTDVDLAESEPDIAMRVNGEAPGLLAEVAKKLNAGLVHYSTDYVFDGRKGEPYTEEDEPNPINLYGQTKVAGDQAIMDSGCAHLILRTSWVYSARGKNFFMTVLRLAQGGKVVRVVDDQVGSPTWSCSIAKVTAEILKAVTLKLPNSISISIRGLEGVYNFCARGMCSWFEFSCAILEGARIYERCCLTEAEPISTEEYPATAVRPRYSVLDTGKVERIFEIRTNSWEVQLEECWKSIKLNRIRRMAR